MTNREIAEREAHKQAMDRRRSGMGKYTRGIDGVWRLKSPPKAGEKLHLKRINMGWMECTLEDWNDNPTDGAPEFTNADFVWLGIKIEQMLRLIHLRAMAGEQVKHFVVAPDLLESLYRFVDKFPELLPKNIKAITFKTNAFLDYDVIETIGG